MARTALTIISLGLCLLGASAQAELYSYEGSLRLRFPDSIQSVEFSIPLTGMVNRSSTSPRGFEFDRTQSFPVSQTLTGVVPNPLPLMSGTLTRFEEVYLREFVLHPGTIGTAGSPLSGLDLDIESIEMLGTTVNEDFVTASLSLVSVAPTPMPATGKLYIFDDSGTVSQPITADAAAWSVATSHFDPNGGTLSLVTPIAITTSHALSAPIEMTAHLQLTFVPEPGVGWMLGAGSLLLAEAGRRRRKRIRT